METLNVYDQLLERLKDPGSPGLRRILQKLVTPEEGEILLQLPLKPEEMAQKTGMDEEIARKQLHEFMERGLVILTSNGLYCLPHDMTQLHDANLASADKWIDEELLDLWKEYRDTEWTKKMAGGLGDSYVQLLKVFPAYRAMEKSPDFDKLPPDENIREIIKGANPIAVVPCTCRRSIKACDLLVEACLHFNRGAEYALDRGAGRQLTIEEANDIFDESERQGLVHTLASGSGQRLTAICNCCRDCCDIFAIGAQIGTIEQILVKSSFRAKVDADLCIGCGDCIDRCFVQAISLDNASIAVVDESKCIGCGLCVVTCQTGALIMRLAEEVNK